MMAPTTVSYRLKEMLARPGCPICHLADAAGASFLDNLIYELVNDGVTRDKIVQAGGFCRRHGWQLVHHGGALGIAIIHRDLIKQTLDAVHSTTFRQTNLLGFSFLRHEKLSAEPQEIHGALRPSVACLACRQEREATELYLQELVGKIALLQSQLRANNALCLPHFRQALVYATKAAEFDSLIAWESSALTQIEGELGEFIRKHDYRFADEPIGTEGDAWQRAVALFSGEEPPSS